MTRISRSRISMEDGRVDNAFLKDYGETVASASTLLYGVDATDVFTNVTDTVNSDGTANWVFGDATSLMRFSGLSTSNDSTLIVKARMRKNSGSGVFRVDYRDGTAVDISDQFVTGEWTVIEATLTTGASGGGWLDFPNGGNYNGYDIDVDYILIYGNAGGTAKVLDIENGNVFSATLTSNITIDFFNPTASGTACSFTLILTQDSTGSRTVTWPASVIWPSGTIPSLATAADSVDVLSFLTVDGGATWFGALNIADIKYWTGTETFTSSGTFTVPTYETLYVKVWGAGGGSGGISTSTGGSGGTGGNSSFGSTTPVVGNGGAGTSGTFYNSGASGAGGVGGTASGGDTNTTGATGASGNGTTGTGGGNSQNQAGVAGSNPGGGAAGAGYYVNNYPYGFNRSSTGKGGQGGIAVKQFSQGDLIPGTSITVTVGAGGTAGSGNQRAGAAGGPGRVTVSSSPIA